MRYLLLLVHLFCVFQVSAQLLYPEVMEKRESILAPVRERYPVRSHFPVRLYYTRLANSSIENPGVRYAIQNLRKEYYPETEVNQALRTLLRYARNEDIQYMIDYMKRYARLHVPLQEKALAELQQYITNDSILYVNEMKMSSPDEYEEYLNTDLQTLVKFMRNDSNYIWLRNADRDSVYLELSSPANAPLGFWINNGRTRYYRFWAGNRIQDTIGTWIQVLPKGNALKIYVDEDVHQTTTVERLRPKIDDPIKNPPREEYLEMKPLDIPAIKRRYWTYYSEVEITMSQGALKNWSSGGENSLSLISNLRYYWNYNRNKTSWESWMHYRFGFMKNGEEEMRKNEDRFELNSKVGQKAFKHWYYTAQFNMITQLFNSYDYPKEKPRKLVANFMSPGDFTLSLGMDYKPNSNLSLVISPIAGKWTIVRDSANIAPSRYGISEAGKRFKRDAGAQVYLISKLNDLLKIMNLNNEVKLFMSYEKKDKYVVEKESQEVRKCLPLTINWKMTLNFKINYFMTASIYTETVYDESFSRKLQFKENLNLGVKFRF